MSKFIVLMGSTPVGRVYPSEANAAADIHEWSRVDREYRLSDLTYSIVPIGEPVAVCIDGKFLEK